MNARDSSPFDDRERLAQAQAEHAERSGLAAGGDARLDRYRFIIRALRQPLPPQLPADFAVRVADLAQQRAREDRWEDWLVMALLLAMGVTGLLFAAPVLAQAGQALGDLGMLNLPWRQFVLGGLGIGVVAALERGWLRWRPRAPS